MHLNLLPIEIIYHIFEYSCYYVDIINFKYLNKHYNKLFENYYDSVISQNINLDDDFYFENYTLYDDNINTLYNNVIVLSNLNELKHLNIKQLKFLDVAQFDSYTYIKNDYILYHSFLKHCNKLEYLKLSDYHNNLPLNLKSLKYLNLLI